MGMKKAKLKSCPFCGGEAEVNRISKLWWAGCDNCGVCLTEYTKNEAVVTWNRRVKV